MECQKEININFHPEFGEVSIARRSLSFKHTVSPVTTAVAKSTVAQQLSSTPITMPSNKQQETPVPRHLDFPDLHSKEQHVGKQPNVDPSQRSFRGTYSSSPSTVVMPNL